MAEGQQGGQGRSSGAAAQGVCQQGRPGPSGSGRSAGARQRGPQGLNSRSPATGRRHQGRPVTRGLGVRQLRSLRKGPLSWFHRLPQRAGAVRKGKGPQLYTGSKPPRALRPRAPQQSEALSPAAVAAAPQVLDKAEAKCAPCTPQADQAPTAADADMPAMPAACATAAGGSGAGCTAAATAVKGLRVSEEGAWVHQPPRGVLSGQRVPARGRKPACTEKQDGAGSLRTRSTAVRELRIRTVPRLLPGTRSATMRELRSRRVPRLLTAPTQRPYQGRGRATTIGSPTVAYPAFPLSPSLPALPSIHNTVGDNCLAGTEEHPSTLATRKGRHSMTALKVVGTAVTATATRYLSIMLHRGKATDTQVQEQGQQQPRGSCEGGNKSPEAAGQKRARSQDDLGTEAPEIGLRQKRKKPGNALLYIQQLVRAPQTQLRKVLLGSMQPGNMQPKAEQQAAEQQRVMAQGAQRGMATAQDRAAVSLEGTTAQHGAQDVEGVVRGTWQGTPVLPVPGTPSGGPQVLSSAATAEPISQSLMLRETGATPDGPATPNVVLLSPVTCYERDNCGGKHGEAAAGHAATQATAAHAAPEPQRCRSDAGHSADCRPPPRRNQRVRQRSLLYTSPLWGPWKGNKYPLPRAGPTALTAPSKGVPKKLTGTQSVEEVGCGGARQEPAAAHSKDSAQQPSKPVRQSKQRDSVRGSRATRPAATTTATVRAAEDAVSLAPGRAQREQHNLQAGVSQPQALGALMAGSGQLGPACTKVAAAVAPASTPDTAAIAFHQQAGFATVSAGAAAASICNRKTCAAQIWHSGSKELHPQSVPGVQSGSDFHDGVVKATVQASSFEALCDRSDTPPPRRNQRVRQRSLLYTSPLWGPWKGNKYPLPAAVPVSVKPAPKPAPKAATSKAASKATESKSNLRACQPTSLSVNVSEPKSGTANQEQPARQQHSTKAQQHNMHGQRGQGDWQPGARGAEPGAAVALVAGASGVACPVDAVYKVVQLRPQVGQPVADEQAAAMRRSVFRQVLGAAQQVIAVKRPGEELSVGDRLRQGPEVLPMVPVEQCEAHTDVAAVAQVSTLGPAARASEQHRCDATSTASEEAAAHVTGQHAQGCDAPGLQISTRVPAIASSADIRREKAPPPRRCERVRQRSLLYTSPLWGPWKGNKFPLPLPVRVSSKPASKAVNQPVLQDIDGHVLGPGIKVPRAPRTGTLSPRVVLLEGFRMASTARLVRPCVLWRPPPRTFDPHALPSCQHAQPARPQKALTMHKQQPGNPVSLRPSIIDNMAHTAPSEPGTAAPGACKPGSDGARKLSFRSCKRQQRRASTLPDPAAIKHKRKSGIVPTRWVRPCCPSPATTALVTSLATQGARFLLPQPIHDSVREPPCVVQTGQGSQFLACVLPQVGASS